MAKYTAIGGQALIEGIMMKSPEKTALAVRTREGEIDISYLEGKSLRERYKIFALPIIRGVVGFAESMIQGYKAMMISADKSGFADLEEEESAEKKDNSVLLNVVMVIGTVLGVALSLVLFMLIPSLITDGLSWAFKTEFSPVVISAIEQVIKLAVFVLYVWGVTFMKDIRRVFMYHGAEHKTIFCYEKGLPLTVENVRQQSRFHPRCGTSFLILMILVSLLFSIAVQLIFPDVRKILWLWVLVKILMVPLICGAGFEVLRFSGRYDNWLTRAISAPGRWMQRITTKEPEDSMIEIAIAALRACEPEVPDVDRSVDETQEENGEETDGTEHL